ncbi:MAG: tetratricopeptide repeat protein, partial [Candidatus Hydrogenedentes bacterium]|nr:tetratricopeptide repeat protein [Candidatus Hydrogenedentota bacterium]
MPNSDAHERFQAASNLYTAGAYADALEIIQELVQQFPDNVNLLKALARTLAKLGRTDEAVAICDRLESEFGYARARAYRDRITGKSRDDVPTIAFEPPAADDEAPPVELTELGGDDEDGKPAKRRFRIKPVRLGLLLLV